MSGYVMTEEHKRKIGLANSGRFGEKSSFFGRHHSEETKKRISLKKTGEKRTAEQRKRISESHKGIIQSAETLLKRSIALRGKKRTEAQKANYSRAFMGRKLSEAHKEKLRKAHLGKTLSAEARRKLSVRFSGSGSVTWKGGITPQTVLIRNSPKTQDWRKQVFARDSWTCKKCGQRGGSLHAHHIFSFSEFPEKRFDVDNGMTLCIACHKQTHNQKRSINHERLRAGLPETRESVLKGFCLSGLRYSTHIYRVEEKRE
jgi:predicted HNH restriction endonuclease